ncbi:hypothetical protein LJC45_01005 [Alistipes sp. OttesenSCG-928-B03]|nr:hypothetical protein [Alistipes sp. OttesenSCG-928-B03]
MELNELLKAGVNMTLTVSLDDLAKLFQQIAQQYAGAQLVPKEPEPEF